MSDNSPYFNLARLGLGFEGFTVKGSIWEFRIHAGMCRGRTSLASAAPPLPDQAYVRRTREA